MPTSGAPARRSRNPGRNQADRYLPRCRAPQQPCGVGALRPLEGFIPPSILEGTEVPKTALV
jgi:hypothetical protein